MAHPRTIWQAKYRVLVLKTPSSEPHARVHAICLEQNIVGRGASVPEALQDLSMTLIEFRTQEWKDLVPTTKSDPDPELLSVFDGCKNPSEDGVEVLDRRWLTMEFDLVPLVSREGRGSHRRPPTMAARVSDLGRNARILYQEQDCGACANA
jgi:hypothetical protein